MDLLAVYKRGKSLSLKSFQIVMAAASVVGLLYMQPFQICLKACVSNYAWNSGMMHVLVICECLEAIYLWWCTALYD